MSPQEIELTLSPQQAASGVVITVNLPTGPATLRIPPARDGDLVRAIVAGEEVSLRIRVAGPPPGSAKKGALGWLIAVGAVAAVVIGLVALNSGNDDDSKNTASSSASPSSSYTPYSPSYPTPSYTPPVYTPDPSVPVLPVLPSLDPTTPAPSPFDKGTCLNGQLPDSEVAQRVDNVEEVSCSASDAHYRVIESIPGTSDMSRCENNSRTEYAFSYKYTLGSTVLNEYVYCLVGLGSYSRA
ncbi:hypothetical protein AB0P15_30420 [Streptomyces sp. NPDC087917]|uniref:LppU/SCO3897 family protein n=1 Tax=unclassified Streptomyces TaxID=2593676 RepID=UPI00341EE4C2